MAVWHVWDFVPEDLEGVVRLDSESRTSGEPAVFRLSEVVASLQGANPGASPWPRGSLWRAAVGRVDGDRAWVLRVALHRDVAAAGPAVAVGGQVQPALDVHPAEGGRLGDRPAVGAVHRVQRQVLRRAPEVLGRVPVEPARVHRHIAVERGVVRVRSEPRDRGVEADLRVDVVVRAPLEQQRVAVQAELRRLLLPEDLVDLALDVGRRRAEDMDVRAEIAAARYGLDLLAVPGLLAERRLGGGDGHEE